MSVHDYDIARLMEVASELAIRTLIREEVQKDSSYSLLGDVRLGSKRLAKIVWTKLNELAERVNRGCAYEKLSWESVREVVKGWKCDRIYCSKLTICKYIPNVGCKTIFKELWRLNINGLIVFSLLILIYFAYFL